MNREDIMGALKRVVLENSCLLHFFKNKPKKIDFRIRKKIGSVLCGGFLLICGLQFVFVNAFTANAEMTLKVTDDGLIEPTTALTLHPYSYHQDFENEDPFEKWASNGTYTINYKGLTTERSSSGNKSFKIDVTFGTATYLYWKIPVKVASAGALSFNGDVFVSEALGASATLGTSIALYPCTGGIDLCNSIKQSTNKWITQNSDLVANGRKKAYKLLPKYCPEATPDDIGIWTDKIGLFIYGKQGSTISVYVDNIKMIGNVPNIDEYKQASTYLWDAFKNRIKVQIEGMKYDIGELANEKFDSTVASILKRQYPIGTEYAELTSIVDGFKKRSLVSTKAIGDKELFDKIKKMPPLFCTALIDPGILSQAGQEKKIAKFPLAIVPQDGRKHHKEWRNKIRNYNPEIVLLAYQMTIEETTVPGPGHDYLREIKNSWVVWPDGVVPTVGPLNKKRRIFDPRKQEWKEYFIIACSATLSSYPYDGLFLDQCTIFAKSHPDSSVRRKMENALQEVLLELRKEFPDKLFVGNCRNSWNGLNGEMIEGNREGRTDEMLQIEGHYAPKLDLFLTRLSGEDDLITLEQEMGLAHLNNSFYGASVDYQHVLWFDIYNKVMGEYK